EHFPILQTAKESWIHEATNVRGEMEAYMWKQRFGIYGRTFYRWGKESLQVDKPNFVRNSKRDLSPETLPLVFRFSGLSGKRYKFGELLGEHPAWSGSRDADTGAVIITPKM